MSLFDQNLIQIASSIDESEDLRCGAQAEPRPWALTNTVPQSSLMQCKASSSRTRQVCLVCLVRSFAVHAAYHWRFEGQRIS